MSSRHHEIEAIKHESAEIEKQIDALRHKSADLEERVAALAGHSEQDDLEARIAIILSADLPLREWYESIGLDHITMAQKGHAYLKSLAWQQGWRDYCDNRLVGTKHDPHPHGYQQA